MISFMAEEHKRKSEDGASPIVTVTLTTQYLRTKGDSSFTDVLVDEKRWAKYRHCKKIIPKSEGKEENVLFNDALTFYLRLYGVGHMVKDHSDSEIGNPLPPHGLLFPINSKGSFICIIPQAG